MNIGKYIGNSTWKKFRAIINGVHDDFNQDIITWRRNTPSQVTLFKEQQNQQFTEIDLEVLVGYNYFRTWPITRQTNSGELDNQNMIVMINKNYLSRLEYLTPGGYLDFNPGRDQFLHRGMLYKAEGDTFLSQAKDNPLFVQLILRREETKTGDKQFK